jgi:hypothetical protein
MDAQPVGPRMQLLQIAVAGAPRLLLLLRSLALGTLPPPNATCLRLSCPQQLQCQASAPSPAAERLSPPLPLKPLKPLEPLIKPTSY